MCKDLRKASSIEALSISQTASFFAAEFEALAIYGMNQTTQPMTATQDFICNINATYENESWGTVRNFLQFARRVSDLSCESLYNSLETAIYQLSYGTLNFTFSQELFEGLR